jgi:hypothetical protein
VGSLALWVCPLYGVSHGKLREALVGRLLVVSSFTFLAEDCPFRGSNALLLHAVVVPVPRLDVGCINREFVMYIETYVAIYDRLEILHSDLSVQADWCIEEDTDTSFIVEADKRRTQVERIMLNIIYRMKHTGRYDDFMRRLERRQRIMDEICDNFDPSKF